MILPVYQPAVRRWRPSLGQPMPSVPARLMRRDDRYLLGVVVRDAQHSPDRRRKRGGKGGMYVDDDRGAGRQQQPCSDIDRAEPHGGAGNPGQWNQHVLHGDLVEGGDVLVVAEGPHPQHSAVAESTGTLRNRTSARKSRSRTTGTSVPAVCAAREVS